MPLRQEQRDEMNSAPSAYSHNSGSAPVNHGLAEIDQHRAQDRAGQRAAAADRDPDHRLDRVGRRELARVDDADLRHVERPADAGHHRGQHPDHQLVGSPAGSRGTACGSPRRAPRPAPCRSASRPRQRASRNCAAQEQRRQHQQRRTACVSACTAKPSMSLKSVMPVVAAEAHVVAEERQQQRIGQRLGDDRQIDAGDARAERQPAEHQRQQRRHQHHHQQRRRRTSRSRASTTADSPAEEHHEVRQLRVAVDAARADLAHQVHAHRVAAEREERRMAELTGCRRSPRPDRPPAPASRSRDTCRPATPT